MNECDREKFIAQLKGLQQVFRSDKTLSGEILETYWQVFNEWSIEKFANACSKLLTTKTIPTFPLPGEIFEAAKNPVGSLNVWLYARSLVVKYGPYMHMEFSDRALGRAIEALGGWIPFCNCPDEKKVFMQRDFLSYYESFSQQETGEEPILLPGLHDPIEENIVKILKIKDRDLLE